LCNPAFDYDNSLTPLHCFPLLDDCCVQVYVSFKLLTPQEEEEEEEDGDE
jgi:hypothetical protein